LVKPDLVPSRVRLLLCGGQRPPPGVPRSCHSRRARGAERADDLATGRHPDAEAWPLRSTRQPATLLAPGDGAPHQDRHRPRSGPVDPLRCTAAAPLSGWRPQPGRAEGPPV